MTHTDQSDLNEADREAHVRLAVEQAAMHAARLALSRWTCGYRQCEAPFGQPLSAQSRWHAAAQNDFTVWLAGGGFAQPGADAGAEPNGTVSDDPAPTAVAGCRGPAIARGSEGKPSYVCAT